jgi:hypothetical protein
VRVASCFESEHGGGVGGYAVVVDEGTGNPLEVWTLPVSGFL